MAGNKRNPQVSRVLVLTDAEVIGLDYILECYFAPMSGPDLTDHEISLGEKVHEEMKDICQSQTTQD